MNTIPATFFDGLTARPHAVTLSLCSDKGMTTWRLDGETVAASHPFNAVRLAPAVGRARRFLHFPDGAVAETDDHEGLQAALTAAGISEPSWIQRLEQHAIGIAIATVLLVAGFLVGFQWALPRLASRVAEAVPASVEQRLARGTLAALDQQILVRSTLSLGRQMELRNRFEDFTRKNGYVGTLQLKFRGMSDGTANAFALPDGTVIVTDRLVALAQRDEEILAVLAHELGHLHHRHSLRQLLQNSITLLLVASVTGDTSALGNFAGALPLFILSAKYSRDHEREADAFARDALTRAGIPPQAFLHIMARMEEDTRRIYGNAPPPFLSTHPPTAERLESYRKLGDNEPAPEATD